jgi:hypothetical protein
VPLYRLIFPTPLDSALVNSETAEIESDEFYEVGAEISYGGKRWRVSQAPHEQPQNGETADLMVWPAE